MFATVRISSLILLLVIVRALPAAADEVVLKNGDRLTGTTTALAGGTLTFATAYGDVKIPWPEVVRLAIQEPILASVAGAPAVPVTIAAGADGQAMLQPGGVVPLGDISLLTRPEPIEAVAEVPDGPPLRFRWRRALHEVIAAEGPERIEGAWWSEHGGPARDYCRVEDKSGLRFWLFRAGLYRDHTHGAGTPAWFLHGTFA